MTRTSNLITFIFIFLGIYPFSLVQAVEPIDCDPEPTDMTIQYGDFLDGSNCSIASGDTDIFRFTAGVGERILVRGSDQSGSNSINVCVELLDPDGLPTPNGTMACGNVTRQIDETIEKEGIHTVIIRDSGVFPISYSINLQCLVGECRNLTPPCDIQLSKETYIDGETVTADVLRVTNLTGESLAVEWKLWLAGPGGWSPHGVANQGADGSLVLPNGTDVDLRPGGVPWPFLPVTAALARGEYEFSCRFLNPITGRLLVEDRNFFDILP